MNRSRRSAWRSAGGSFVQIAASVGARGGNDCAGWWRSAPTQRSRNVDVKRGGRTDRPAQLSAIRENYFVVASRGLPTEKTGLAPAAQGHRAERGRRRSGREQRRESSRARHADSGVWQLRNRGASGAEPLPWAEPLPSWAVPSSLPSSWWHLCSTTVRMGSSLSLSLLASVAVSQVWSPRPRRGAQRRAQRRPRPARHLRSRQLRARRRRSFPRGQERHALRPLPRPHTHCRGLRSASNRRP